MTLEDILETEEMYQKRMALKKASKTDRKFQQDDNVYCFIDDTKMVNTFVLTTYSPPDDKFDAFKDTIVNCVNEFDKNTYPIQIILKQNGGGIANLELTIQKAFAPYNNDVNFNAMRISDYSKRIMESGYIDLCFDLDTCKKVGENTTFYDKPREIKYGDVTHKITQITTDGFEPAANIKMKNIRKPTEIVVYTDSFCFSCCSVTAKGMKEHGSAIMVGFDGDPGLTGTDKFEVGQSPTAVVTLSNQFKETNKPFELDAYGISVGVSFAESFRYNYEYTETVPKEFLIDEIDERTTFTSYDDAKLDQFTTKTLELVEKYKTKCNPKNKRLVKVDSACDATAQKIDKNARGGYLCGDNGEWTTTCVISHCDVGYVFDHKNQKCLIDVCNPPKDSGNNGTIPSGPSTNDNKPSGNSGNQNNNNGSVTKNILMMIMMFVALFI